MLLTFQGSRMSYRALPDGGELDTNVGRYRTIASEIRIRNPSMNMSCQIFSFDVTHHL